MQKSIEPSRILASAGTHGNDRKPAHPPGRSGARWPSCKRTDQHRADQAACRIGGQVIPTCLPAWQKDLVPFIKAAHQQGTRESEQNHAPAAQSACQANTCRQHGKQAGVRQFVPGRRNQAHGHGLCAPHKKAEQNPDDKQSRNGPSVPF